MSAPWPAIGELVAHHADEAAFLWRQRPNLVDAPHLSLAGLAAHDEHRRAPGRPARCGRGEGWYNPRRRHSALGHRSPRNFERSHHDVQPQRVEHGLPTVGVCVAPRRRWITLRLSSSNPLEIQRKTVRGT